ncbi:hypothetical protein PVAG01_10302 [Phlyctema vagabunda]|uniref:Uncharacterized protein n=1 Tax=Phlyctema vagabunda TaxID=108571 RepID=A0ABR4P5M7_9HELO
MAIESLQLTMAAIILDRKRAMYPAMRGHLFFHNHGKYSELLKEIDNALLEEELLFEDKLQRVKLSPGGLFNVKTLSREDGRKVKPKMEGVPKFRSAYEKKKYRTEARDAADTALEQGGKTVRSSKGHLVLEAAAMSLVHCIVADGKRQNTRQITIDMSPPTTTLEYEVEEA